MTTSLDSKTLNEIIDYLCNELGGDWLLTGGALVRLNFDASRGTEDVDLVRISHPEYSDEATRNALFQWLMRRGLGPEWVNTAVEPFVREASGWEQALVSLRKGLRGEVLRPNLTLFTYLKLRRGTETDIKDIAAAAKACPEGFSDSLFAKWADAGMQRALAGKRDLLGLPKAK